MRIVVHGQQASRDAVNSQQTETKMAAHYRLTDGTVTQYDFFELGRKRWPSLPQDDPWEKYVTGRITHFEALAEIFARILRSGHGEPSVSFWRFLERPAC